MSKTIKEMALESTKNLFESEDLQTIVDRKVKSAVTSVIEDLFSYSSKFRKDLETKINEGLNLNFDNLNMTEYNHLILKIIEAKIDETIINDGTKRMKEDLAKLLSSGQKKEIKLSDIIEELKGDANDDAINKCWDEISLHIEKSDIVGSELIFIHFDKEPDRERYECNYRIVASDGICSSVSAKDYDYSKTTPMGGIYGMERYLFRLYANKTKLIIDEDDVNFYYCRDDEY